MGIFNNGATPGGICDFSGNVWEWTCSNYHTGKVRDDFDFDPELQKLLDEDKTDEFYNKLEEKDRQLPVLRGGSWYDDRDVARCAYRDGFNPDLRLSGLGFRCARTKK